MKILNELDELQQAGIITPEVAQNIRVYAQRRKPDTTNNFLTIFGIIGAILIGLGLILIVAHNWDDLSREVKTIIAFTPLIIGQAGCLWVLVKPQKMWLKESFSVFTALSIGLCIATVHQIYNLPDSHLSDFIRTWILLGIPLVYVMKSKSVALLYMIGTFSYIVSLDDILGTFSYNGLFLQIGFILAILPFYYQLFKTEANSNYTAVFHWFFTTTLLCVIFANASEEYIFPLIITSYWAFIYIGKYLENTVYYNAYKIIAIAGIAGLLFYSYNFGVNSLWSDFLYIAVVLFGWQLFYIYKKNWVKKQPFDWLEAFPILIIVQVYWGISSYISDLLALALGVWYLTKGLKSHRFLLINFGLVLMTYTIGQRFFDADIPFLLKGLVFIALGVSFFLVNYLIVKKIRKNA